jgi:hypothetical protein
MTIWGPDENRTVEAIAAILEVFPRLPGEGDAALADRLAQWGILQGPNVRRDAVLHATQAMIAKLGPGVHFGRLAEIGMHALGKYNESRFGGMD